MTKKGVVPAATITLGHLYEGERKIGPSMNSTKTSVLHGTEVGRQEADIDSSNEGAGIQESKFQHYEIDTPILNLLCGPTVYELVDRDKFMEAIMTNLGLRVQVDEGSCVPWAISVGASPITHLRLRQLCEYRLTHWVIANTAAFPVWLSTPMMFTCILLCDTVVLDILIDSRKLLPRSYRQCKVMVNIIFRTSSRREVLQQIGKQFSISRLRSDVQGIITSAKYTGVAKRRLLEKVLRRIAFDNKDKFPELKFFAVVKA
ncbi:hypothetical protein J1614_012154 [Plenodomus biglobosus]|nr:hypothetical protein J1614_012154 [Plenodomus biglobosus]